MLDGITSTALGNKALYETLIRRVFDGDGGVLEDDVRAFCLRTLYRAGAQLEGAITLLVTIQVLNREADCLCAGPHFPVVGEDVSLAIGQRIVHWFTEQHEVHRLFPPGSVSLGADGQVAVHLAKVPLRFLPVIKLLRDLRLLANIAGTAALLCAVEPFGSTIVKAAGTRRPHDARRGLLTPEQLEQIQALMAAQGFRAEQFVMAFERKRLAEHPGVDRILQVSCEDVNAGYDIESYHSLGSVSLDRFIEVKSYADKEGFFISAGEIDAASRLGGDYFLYLVDAGRMADPDYFPAIIPNPSAEVFGAEAQWSMLPVTFRVVRKP